MFKIHKTKSVQKKHKFIMIQKTKMCKIILKFYKQIKTKIKLKILKLLIMK